MDSLGWLGPCVFWQSGLVILKENIPHPRLYLKTIDTDFASASGAWDRPCSSPNAGSAGPLNSGGWLAQCRQSSE